MTEATEELEVVVGIYEGFVIGYRVTVDRSEVKLLTYQR